MAWAFYGTMLYAGRRKMLLLKRPPDPLKVPPPGVTILVPAKDEGERIRACIQSALDQDYPNFDMVVIDDRSMDNTGAIMDEMAAANSKLRVVHIRQLPAPGWTGKNNALHTGVQHAGGEWFLFVDSDVLLERDVLSACMSVVMRKKFDMISLLPRLESHSFWEGLLVPLAAGAASSMYLIALTNNNLMPKTAFANGQYLMIKRSAYETIGGHETVRDRFCEDMQIARLMKSRGLRPRVSWGNDFASVRMYSSLGAILRGWARIYYAAQVGTPGRVLAALSFVIVCCFSAYAALAWGIWRLVHPGRALWGYIGLAWLLASLVHIGLLTYFLGVLYSWSGNRRRNAWLFPLGGAMLVSIFLRSVRMCITKKVEWRGTKYSHNMAADLATTSTQKAP